MNSRIIKFRVWNKTKKSFVKKPKRFHQESWGLSYFGGSEYMQKNNLIIQQFTGFCDKKGVEIYEGDIVKFSNLFYLVMFDGHWEAVCYNYHTYLFPRIIGNEIRLSEVVGNEFENSNLLKEKYNEQAS